MNRLNCMHRRIKKNYPFGKKSTPRMVCKDCGMPISPKLRFEIKGKNKKNRGKN